MTFIEIWLHPASDTDLVNISWSNITTMGKMGTVFLTPVSLGAANTWNTCLFLLSHHRATYSRFIFPASPLHLCAWSLEGIGLCLRSPQNWLVPYVTLRLQELGRELIPCRETLCKQDIHKKQLFIGYYNRQQTARTYHPCVAPLSLCWTVGCGSEGTSSDSLIFVSILYLFVPVFLFLNLWAANCLHLDNLVSGWDLSYLS